MSGSLRILLVAVFICFGSAAGFLAAHFFRGTSGMRSEGSAVRPMAEAGLPPQGPPQDVSPAPQHIPSSVPNVVMPDLSGAQQALSQWRGHPLLINFWATWCEPCRREIPLLESLQKHHAADQLQVIGIAVDGREAVRTYVRQTRIDYPVLVGEDAGLRAVAAFGMQAVLPFSVFVDSQGNILTLKVGELHPEEAHYILDAMRALEQGRTQLTAARQEISSAIAAFSAQRARRTAATAEAPER